ncbi:MAG: hypothetical protein K0R54_5065 [Clostridiaceae bacterium]|jgi:hypothetical protein|nr:hypothetical protein [Clostridiaceae bacterium]
MSKHDISNLVRYARNNQQKNHGFNYDYIFYNIDYNRKTKQIVYDSVNSMDF